MNMEQKAFVDRDICIGCSVCTETCPAVFQVREDPEHGQDFKSFTDDSVEQEKIAALVQQAIDCCPVQCISWRKIEGGVKSNGPADA